MVRAYRLSIFEDLKTPWEYITRLIMPRANKHCCQSSDKIKFGVLSFFFLLQKYFIYVLSIMHDVFKNCF